MTLATIDESGSPWASPVFYSHDDDHNLYWVSDKDALHSENVRKRPDVAIAIQNTVYGAIDAVYIRAKAAELIDDAEIRHGMAVMEQRPQIDKWKIGGPSEVTGDGPWRIYKAVRQSTEVRRNAVKQKKDVVAREPADF